MKKIPVALRIIDSVRIALALVIIIAMISCTKEKKEAVDASQPVAEKKIKESVSTTDASDFNKYTYDVQGKLSKVESNTYMWIFEYQPSKMIVDGISKSLNKSTGKREYILDASGRTIEVISRQSNGSVNSNMYIEYDAAGYLSKAKTVYADNEISEIRLTTSGGNVVREDAYANDVFKDRTDYFYDPSIKNKGHNSMALLTWGIKGLYGKDYANECNGYKRYTAAGALTTEMNATIVTDADGYTVKKTFVYPLTNQSREYQFIYQ